MRRVFNISLLSIHNFLLQWLDPIGQNVINSIYDFSAYELFSPLLGVYIYSHTDTYIYIINEYMIDFIYLMPWKFVNDMRFH